MLKYSTLNILILYIVILPLNTLSKTNLLNVESLKQLAGNGQILVTHPPSLKQERINGQLIFINDIDVEGEINCSALVLVKNHNLSKEIHEQYLVAISTCSSGASFICLGRPDICDKVHSSQTKVEGNSLERYLSYGDVVYRVEIFKNKFILKEKESKCLLSSPHGCIIPLPGWKDYLVYSFTRD